MITCWIHHDFLVRLESQLALCLWTFWVLLRRHPATSTFHLGLELCTIRSKLSRSRVSWWPCRCGRCVTWTGVGLKTLNKPDPTSLVPSILVPSEPSVTLLGSTVTRHKPSTSAPKVQSPILYTLVRRNLGLQKFRNFGKFWNFLWQAFSENLGISSEFWISHNRLSPKN